jgi:hypothetical protein
MIAVGTVKNWIFCPAVVCLALFNLTGCGKNTLSCHDTAAKLAIRDYFSQSMAPFYRGENLEVLVRNIRTVNVDNATGERTCTAEAIVGDRSSGQVFFVNRIAYTTTWNEEAKIYDIRVTYRGQ